MRDLLLEIGVEELPARFIGTAVEQLRQSIVESCREQRIAFGEAQVFSTPRRLAVRLTNVAQHQEDLEQDVKGPPASIAYDAEGALTKAGEGFARSQGVTPEQLIRKEVGGNAYLFAHRFVPGQSSETVLPQLLETAVRGLAFPKNMRWGNYDIRYARPIRWLVALFGQDVLPVQVENVRADRQTRGHRQLAPEPVVLEEPAAYERALFDAFVIAVQEQRRDSIAAQVAATAAANGGHALVDDDLLDEVCNLVEFPTAFCGTFQPEFLSVPNEVLITSMKEHQRYFPVVNADGDLLPLFVGVRNGIERSLDVVIEGNEKVLTARLADAKFFFDEDQRKPLSEHAARLVDVVFQEGLGTMADKVQRLVRLSGSVAELLGWHDIKAAVERTAHLAKADLTTQMVYEFPELQGIMGQKYALLQSEDPDTASGIAEHYLPKFAGDRMPQTPQGYVVSLADKLDTLAGYFALGKVPTGSQDPFALRRQALGVVQLLEGKAHSVSLAVLCEMALDGYAQRFSTAKPDIIQSLLEFFRQRLRAVLLDKGYRYDTIDAVLTVDPWVIPEAFARVDALETFRRKPEFTDLYTVLERAANLGSKGSTMEIERSVLTEADLALWNSLANVRQRTDQAWESQDWQGYLSAMAELEKPVATFFDAVMVMDKDAALRANRLALLKHVAALGQRYADFRKIVVEA